MLCLEFDERMSVEVPNVFVAELIQNPVAIQAGLAVCKFIVVVDSKIDKRDVATIFKTELDYRTDFGMNTSDIIAFAFGRHVFAKFVRRMLLVVVVDTN